METPPLALALLDVFESARDVRMSKSCTRESSESLIASPRRWLLDGKLPHPHFFLRSTWLGYGLLSRPLVGVAAFGSRSTTTLL